MSLAHRLRHRITIERKSVTRNSIGEEVVVWESFVENVPAAVNPCLLYTSPSPRD